MDFDSMISTSCIYQSLKLIKVNQTGDQNNLAATVKTGNTDPEVATIKSVSINVWPYLAGQSKLPEIMTRSVHIKRVFVKLGFIIIC